MASENLPEKPSEESRKARLEHPVTIERQHLEDIQELWYALDQILTMLRDTKEDGKMDVYYILKPVNDRLSFLFAEHLDRVLLDSKEG
jgi:hypothetical protein